MAADMPRKSYRYTCNIVRPQAYSEGTIYESLMNAISDVVPQAYMGNQKLDDREKILWVRFENTDCSDVFKNPDLYKSDAKGLPLLLILGYSNGVQIWLVSVNGEAQELLSIRQGPIKLLRILPNPEPVMGRTDSFCKQRPLVIICDSSGAGQPYCGIKFVSLKTGDEVHSISFKTLTIQGVECNNRFVVVTFLKQLCVYDACQFKQLFWITSCYPCTGPSVNPVALSTRWLAYADKRLVPMHQSCGGMSGDGAQSYAATVISAAKGAFQGLSKFGETMMNTVTGTKPIGVRKPDPEPEVDNADRPGIVSVIDIQSVFTERFNVTDDTEVEGLIAHFHAHANEPIAHMAFDPSGTMLITACKLGHNFHVFRLMAHPCSSSLGAVHHLYTLYRGDTTAKVVDISFNHDSRWVTVSTHRGTTHLFPITPYGGPVNVRTHCQPCVVNRASRFQKSAGLEDMEHSLRGRQSPILSTSPGGSGQHRQYDRYPKLIQQNTLNNNMGNPRLPPYPHPTTVYPAYQVKQSSGTSLNPVTSSPSHGASGQDYVCCVAAKFCSPRLCVVGSPRQGMERRDSAKRPVDALFIMTQSGYLIEYMLEPRPAPVHEKVSDSSSLELVVTGRIQWCLQRFKTSLELRPPLPSNSPLLLAHEAVVSQVPTAPDLSDLPGITRQDSKDSLSSDHSGKDDNDELWLSQIEIMTHVGPHRRLWMGPQFSFKTYSENTTVLSSNSSALLSQSPDVQHAMDLGGDEGDLESLKLQPTRSNPVSMPNARPAYRRLSGSDSSPSPGPGRPGSNVMVIEAGSYEHSPHLQDVYTNWAESTVVKEPRGSDDLEEDRIKETLADAMVESPIKDMEKMSLRQEIPRTGVAVGKEKSQMAGRKAGRDSREKGERKDGGASSKIGSGIISQPLHKAYPDITATDSSPIKGSLRSRSNVKDEGTQMKATCEFQESAMSSVNVACQTYVPGQALHTGIQPMEMKAVDVESKFEADDKVQSNAELVPGKTTTARLSEESISSPEECFGYKSLTSSASEIAVSCEDITSSFEQKSSPEVYKQSKRKSDGNKSSTRNSPERASFADTESSPDTGFSYSTPKSKCTRIAEEKRPDGSSESSFEAISVQEVAESKEACNKSLKDNVVEKSSGSKSLNAQQFQAEAGANKFKADSKTFVEDSSSDPTKPFTEETKYSKDKVKGKGKKAKKNKNKNVKTVENVTSTEDECKVPDSSRTEEISSLKKRSDKIVDDGSVPYIYKDFSTPDSYSSGSSMPAAMSGLPGNKRDEEIVKALQNIQCAKAFDSSEVGVEDASTDPSDAATQHTKKNQHKTETESLPLCMLQSVYEEAMDSADATIDVPKKCEDSQPDGDSEDKKATKEQDNKKSVGFDTSESASSEFSDHIDNVEEDVLGKMKEAISEEQMESVNKAEGRHSDIITASELSHNIVTEKKSKGRQHSNVVHITENPSDWENPDKEKSNEDLQCDIKQSKKETVTSEVVEKSQLVVESACSSLTSIKTGEKMKKQINVCSEDKMYTDETIKQADAEHEKVASSENKFATGKSDAGRTISYHGAVLKETTKSVEPVHSQKSKCPWSSIVAGDRSESTPSEEHKAKISVEQSSWEQPPTCEERDLAAQELEDAALEDDSVKNSPTNSETSDVSSSSKQDSGARVNDDSSGKSAAEASGRTSEDRECKEDTNKELTSSKKKRKKKNRK